jgi:hypothetical protein
MDSAALAKKRRVHIDVALLWKDMILFGAQVCPK